jgi:hypothetical protein
MDCEVLKFGELPAFGPPTPPALLRLLDNEQTYYLKGRRAESQGMGIAAFAYYRRVVENRKNDFIDEIIRVARHLGADEATVRILETAKLENSFAKSVEIVKPAIPSPLLLRGGHNPMTLLHTALSEGIHTESDEDCLSLAGDIRNVLIDFVGRAAMALQETAELNSSVTRLLQRQAGKVRAPSADQKPDPKVKE